MCFNWYLDCCKCGFTVLYFPPERSWIVKSAKYEMANITLTVSGSQLVLLQNPDFTLEVMWWPKSTQKSPSHQTLKWYYTLQVKCFESVFMLLRPIINNWAPIRMSLEWFLKDHVTLKTLVMMLKIQLCIIGINCILQYIQIEIGYLKL